MPPEMVQNYLQRHIEGPYKEGYCAGWREAIDKVARARFPQFNQQDRDRLYAVTKLIQFNALMGRAAIGSYEELVALLP